MTTPTITYASVAVSLPVGHRFLETSNYDGLTEFTNLLGVPATEDLSIAAGVGEIVTLTKFEDIAADFVALGVEPGQMLVIGNSGLSNDAGYEIAAVDNSDPLNHTLIIIGSFTALEFGLDYAVVPLPEL